MDRAIKTSIDLPVPIFRRRFTEALAQHEAGIVDEDVEAAEIGLHARDHASHRFETCDVRAIGLGLAAGLIDVCNDCFRLILRRMIIYRDRSPRRGETLRDRSA